MRDLRLHPEQIWGYLVLPPGTFARLPAANPQSALQSCGKRNQANVACRGTRSQ